MAISTIPNTERRIENVQDALAIVANGNTHAAIASGQCVYVRAHSTLADGLYFAKSAIAVNGALSASNLTAIGNGGLNALQSKYDQLQSATVTWDSAHTPTREDIAVVYKKGQICQLIFWNVSWANEITTDTTVGTIPAGYRPPEKTSFFGYNRQQELCRGWIGPDGGLRISLFPCELMYVSCTYLAAY